MINKSDPKEKKPSLATAWDDEPSLEPGSIVHIPEPVINIPEPMINIPEPMINIPEPVEHPRTLPG